MIKTSQNMEKGDKYDVPDTDPEGNKRSLFGTKQAPSKRFKMSKADMYKPPTVEELATLKESGTLYHTNLFKLQMEELRSEVEVSEKMKKTLLPALQSVEEILQQVSPWVIPEVSQLEGSLPKNVSLPLRWAKTQLKGEVTLRKPAQVKVVGSYVLGTCLNDPFVVDMAVRIPIECLQPKDYLNFRYHHKRALYCVYLAKHLKKKKKDIVENVMYGSLHGESLAPVVLLKLTGQRANVRLIPCLPETGFKDSRFTPSKSNIRQQWYTNGKQEESFPPSPHYNSLILRDMSMERHLHFLYSASHDFPAFQGAVLLLKVWLRQRELSAVSGGCNGFLISMLIAHLLNCGKVNRVMSSQQVIKNVLHFIATSDWTSAGVSMCRTNEREATTSLDEFHQHFPVVVVDPSGYLNLCADMSVASYRHLRHEAQQSLGCLDNKQVDGFHSLFMTPVPFIRKFDHLIVIEKTKQLRGAVKKFGLQPAVMDRSGDVQRAVIPRLVEVLKQALGERILLVAVQTAHTAEWPVNTPPPRWEDQGPLTFGLLLNGSLASSILDKGPPANTPEAKEFSAFWGSKSELRRFQDGSICEAVVWPGSSTAEKRVVCSHIVRHVLHQHAGIDPSSVSYVGGQLDILLHQAPPKLSPPSSSSSTTEKGAELRTGEEEHALLSAAFTRLSRLLRGLKDLPLAISSVQATSPALRRTEVLPPSPGCPVNRLRTVKPFIPVKTPSPDKQCPVWVPSFKVVCHLESSGKWPDDLEAIHHIKAAFHVKMADLLRKHCQLVTAPTASHVFVTVDGFVFQVCVAHRREIVLLKEIVTKEGLSMLRDNDRSKAVETETEHLPHLSSVLSGVHQLHPSFGPTVRLAKRWVSAHLLTDHVTPESVELVVAHLFLHPAPFTAPVCPQTGFLRFLSLISKHDWESTPLIVNFNNDLKASEYEEIRQFLANNRSHLPAMFLATPGDQQTSRWTQDKPSIQILKRLVALARESLTVVQQQLLSTTSSSVDYKQIFRPPLDPYDVVIHLRGKLIPRRHQAVDLDNDDDSSSSSQVVLNPSQDAKHIPVVNFDPVQCYLQELREAFDEVALFFHDTYGGDVIAVLWKRPAFQPQPFKPLQAQAKVPTSSRSTSAKTMLVTPNIEGILQDFRIMGRGLVTSIEVRTDNWNM